MEEKGAELVPVKINRIFDSCCDRACFSAVPVVLSVGELPVQVCSVKAKGISVASVSVSVEPIPFQRGFFTISLSVSFRAELQTYGSTGEAMIAYTGTALAEKNYILFGSEVGSASFQKSGEASVADMRSPCDFPEVNVSTVPPTVLGAQIGLSGAQRTVLLDIGLFVTIELSRPMTVLLPVYPYTIPEHSDRVPAETPVEIFRRLEFPSEAFVPASLPQEAGD